MKLVPDIRQAREFLSAYPQLFLVYDRNLAPVAAALEGVCLATKAIDATEGNKSMDTVLDLCRWLLDLGADRSATLVALGGGITTDICGFAASVYKRGIRFGFIPTTLLAQVDAAIGGKNGVNLDGYKNMIGIIREPEFTLIMPSLLETLPQREWRGGTAELLKTFIIDNTDGRYEEAVKILSPSSTVQNDIIPSVHTVIPSASEGISSLIASAASVKERIVAEDLYEHGVRRKLNLGHTFAHAIERRARLSGADISHGEAVAEGIILAARLSERISLAPAGLEERLRRDWTAVGLPTDSPFPPATLAADMAKDKKAEGDKVDFVLIRSIGDVVSVRLTVSEVIALL